MFLRKMILSVTLLLSCVPLASAMESIKEENKGTPPKTPQKYEETSDKDIKEAHKEFFKKVFVEVPNVFGPYKEITARFPKHLYPILPESYRWSVEGKEFIVESYEGAPSHKIEFVVYGPNEKNKINYLTLIDGQNYQSFAHTQFPSFKSNEGRYVFRELLTTPANGYATRSRVNLGKQFLDGHCIDKADTISYNPHNQSHDSNRDPKNHIPEPWDTKWGKNVRQSHVANLRTQGASYMQFPYYGENPSLTDQPIRSSHKITGNKYVPEGVYFVDVAPNYQVTASFNISWSDPIHIWDKKSDGGHAKDHLQKRSLQTWSLVPYVYHPETFSSADVSFFGGVALAKMGQGNKNTGELRSLTRTLDDLRKISDLKHMEIYSLKTAATNEFESPQYKIWLMSYLLTRQIPKREEAQLWEKRAEVQASFLDALDSNISILTESEFSTMEQLFRIKGVDDDRTRYDFWKQLYSNQNEFHKNRIHPGASVFIKPGKMEVTPSETKSKGIFEEVSPGKQEFSTPPKVSRKSLNHGSSASSLGQASTNDLETPTHSSPIPPNLSQFSEENYQYLLNTLEKQFVPSQITLWAGYSGSNGNRDLQKMREQTYSNKEERWNNLVSALGKDEKTRSFLSPFSNKTSFSTPLVSEKVSGVQDLLTPEPTPSPLSIRRELVFATPSSSPDSSKSVSQSLKEGILLPSPLTFSDIQNTHAPSLSVGQIHLQYNEKNYQKLITNLEKDFSPAQITLWAGYSGSNGTRDLRTMGGPNYGDKKTRWDNLVKSLREQGKEVSTLFR